MKHSVYLLLLIFIAYPIQSYAQQDTSSFFTITTPKKLFETDSILQVTLVANFDDIVRDVDDDRKYHDGKLLYHNTNKNLDSLSVEIKTRGNFRRSRQNCSFPPLRLKFEDSMTIAPPLWQGQDKLKLVVPCRKNDDYQTYILQEYYTYRLFNILTDYSLKVRLLELTTVNTGDKNEAITRYGFVIEPEEDLANRMNAKIMQLENFHAERAEYKQMTLVYLFEYMIGNTDWSVAAQHNIILLSRQGVSQMLPVPYDFDWSGMVNAIYAKPQDFLGIKSVRERLYMGYCRTNTQWQPFFDYFNQKRPEIYSLYENSLLSESAKKKSIAYLDEFYDVINSPTKVKYEIHNVCKQ